MGEDFARSGYIWKYFLTLHKLEGLLILFCGRSLMDVCVSDLFSECSVSDGITKVIL